MDNNPKTDALSLAEARARYQHYREEDKHECNLISYRVTALLTCQSLLLTAFVISQSQGNKTPELLKIIFAATGCGISMVGLIAIFFGCRILGKWHTYANQLIETNPGAFKNYSIRTNRDDSTHFFSVDFFAKVIPLCLLFIWGAVLYSLLFPAHFPSAEKSHSKVHSQNLSWRCG